MACGREGSGISQALLSSDACHGKLSETLALAQERARSLGLPYAGALTPREAWDVLQPAPGSKLVDVRTRANGTGSAACRAPSRSSGCFIRAMNPTPTSWHTSNVRSIRKRW
jgi:hypothetical protein